jgi:hypothetical protein
MRAKTHGLASRKWVLPSGCHLWTLIIGLQKNIGKRLSGKTMTIGSKEDNNWLLQLYEGIRGNFSGGFKKRL